MASLPLLLCLVLAITLSLAAAEPAAKNIHLHVHLPNNRTKDKAKDKGLAPVTAGGKIGQDKMVFPTGHKLLDLSGPAGGKGQDYMDVLLGVRDQSGRINGEEARQEREGELKVMMREAMQKYYEDEELQERVENINRFCFEACLPLFVGLLQGGLGAVDPGLMGGPLGVILLGAAQVTGG